GLRRPAPQARRERREVEGSPQRARREAQEREAGALRGAQEGQRPLVSGPRIEPALLAVRAGPVSFVSCGGSVLWSTEPREELHLRLLIVHGYEPSGHASAALALETAAKEKGHDALRVNISADYHPVLGPLIAKSYLAL